MSGGDDDDIAATLAGLDTPHAAPVDDDTDIAQTLAGLDTPTAAHAARKPPPVDLSKMDFPSKVEHWESGGNSNAKAPTSSASGSGQFIDGTWLPLVKKHRPDLAFGKSDQQLLDMRSDPKLNSQMIDAYGADNSDKLKTAGIPTTDATKYGAHWFGPENFQKIYQADPRTPIEKIIGHDAAANNGLTGKTAGEVKDLTAQRMGADHIPQDMSWGDTLSQAGSNLLPSIGKNAAGIYDAVTHPIDTASTLKKIAVGLDSKIEGLAGRQQDPDKKAQDEALVDALKASYAEKYGTAEGFKRYLATDPAGVAFDASTLLTGGETALAKAGSMVGKLSAGAGDALTTASKVAGTAGRAVNPLNPLGVVSKTVKAVTTPAAVLDKAGNVVPKVAAMIQKVTGGTMKGSDLADPAKFAETIAKKGLSEDSVREGLMASLDLKTPTQAVTGKTVPLAGRDSTVDAIKANNEALEKHAAGIGSDSTSDIAAALDKAHTTSMNSAAAAYEKIRNISGSFGKTMPGMADLGKEIQRRFSASGIPAADFDALKQTNPQAAAAVKLLNDRWGSGKTLTRGGQFDAKEVLAMRKALSDMRQSASGSDIKAMHDVTNAFDAHVANQSSAGKFIGGNGKPVYGVGNQIKAANAAYKQHFNTFEGQGNPISAAVKNLKVKQDRDVAGNLLPSGDDAHYTKVQGSLASALMHPTKGQATYNQLTKAIGSSAPVDDFIRGQVLGNKNSAELLKSSPVVQKAFASSPGDLSRAKHIQSVSDINNAKPTNGGGSSLRGILDSMVFKGAAGAAGYETLGVPGIVAGPIAEHLGEKFLDARAAKNALKGAPSTTSTTGRVIKKALQGATSPFGIGSAHYKDEAQKIADRPGHASGGKVAGIDGMVDKLVSRWRSAKKATNETTKPLLNVPDAAIVKALDIAQESI